MVGTGVDGPEAEPGGPREGIGVPFCIQWAAVTGFNRGADVIESESEALCWLKDVEWIGRQSRRGEVR